MCVHSPVFLFQLSLNFPLPKSESELLWTFFVILNFLKQGRIQDLENHTDPTKYGSDQIRIRPNTEPTKYGSNQIWIPPNTDPTKYGSATLVYTPYSLPLSNLLCIASLIIYYSSLFSSSHEECLFAYQGWLSILQISR